MIKLIIGNKGAGKTKKLIDLVNSCVENSDGNIVCIENEPKLTYDVSSKARLLETDTYSIRGHKAFYGFLAGICAGFFRSPASFRTALRSMFALYSPCTVKISFPIQGIPQDLICSS